MSKIIIENVSELSDKKAIEMVNRVMDAGFISGEKQYCWVTTCSNGHVVIARETRGLTHSFKVMQDEK